MRYYRLVITDPDTGKVFTPPGFEGLLGGASYTSFVNGVTLPAAWNVLLDLPIIGAASPQGYGLVRIMGISLAEISQASQLGPPVASKPGKNIQVFGGMQRGLPLAAPEQSGLLFAGTIVQAFGNWIGTDMTLDLVVIPGLSSSGKSGGVGTLSNPKNIVLNWKGGTGLGPALKSALQTAFPGYTVEVNVDAKLVSPGDQVTAYPTLEELAKFVLQASKNIIKRDDYPGVTIMPPALNNKVSAFDGPATGSNPKQIAFSDLIGQPTWIEGSIISLKTVMRANLFPQDQITLPQTPTTNSAQAAPSQINQRSAFQGGFSIISGRHVGEFRQPSADGWVSVFECAPNVLVSN